MTDECSFGKTIAKYILLNGILSRWIALVERASRAFHYFSEIIY